MEGWWVLEISAAEIWAEGKYLTAVRSVGRCFRSSGIEVFCAQGDILMPGVLYYLGVVYLVLRK